MIAEGDRIWFIHDGYPIAIQCTVLEIDSYGDLILDEPVGQEIEEADVLLTREEAATKLIEVIEEVMIVWKEEGFDQTLGEFAPEGDYTLEQYRRDIMGAQEKAIWRKFSSIAWPEKERDEWLSLNDARTMRGMSRSEFEELYGDD